MDNLDRFFSVRSSERTNEWPISHFIFLWPIGPYWQDRIALSGPLLLLAIFCVFICSDSCSCCQPLWANDIEKDRENMWKKWENRWESKRHREREESADTRTLRPTYRIKLTQCPCPPPSRLLFAQFIPILRMGEREKGIGNEEEETEGKGEEAVVIWWEEEQRPSRCKWWWPIHGKLSFKLPEILYPK